MHVVFKYHVTADKTHLPIPHTAKLIHFGLDNDGKPSVWVLQDLNHAIVDGRTLYGFMTGEEIPQELSLVYSGTINNGGIIVHFFQRASFV